MISLVGPILFVIEVNDLPDNLATDNLLYVSSPLRHYYILESPLGVIVSWSKGWELDLNLTKSEHPPIGNWLPSVTYTPIPVPGFTKHTENPKCFNN